ncbi:hypothetical protein BGW41_005577 [Actinomortierella wolfii]|nr:hypothetical protein BGW41_005577 [Actinomortierella wolfii]
MKSFLISFVIAGILAAASFALAMPIGSVYQARCSGCFSSMDTIATVPPHHLASQLYLDAKRALKVNKEVEAYVSQPSTAPMAADEGEEEEEEEEKVEEEQVVRPSSSSDDSADALSAPDSRAITDFALMHSDQGAVNRYRRSARSGDSTANKRLTYQVDHSMPMMAKGETRVPRTMHDHTRWMLERRCWNWMQCKG